MMFQDHPLNNILEWNGKYLGEFDEKSVVHEWVYNADVYHLLKLWNKPLYCQMRNAGDKYPIIADRIKGEVFDLYQRGTHTITIGDSLYILFYVPIDDNWTLMRETRLNEIPPLSPLRYDNNFRKQVQEVLIYREIMGISSTCESSIGVRLGNDKHYFPLSMHEISTTICNRTSAKKGFDYGVLRMSIFRKWFSSSDEITDALKKLLGCPIDDIEGIFKVKNKIDQIINEVNPRFSWYASKIELRILNISSFSSEYGTK